jgi:hypothetical protein
MPKATILVPSDNGRFKKDYHDFQKTNTVKSLARYLKIHGNANTQLTAILD